MQAINVFSFTCAGGGGGQPGHRGSKAGLSTGTIALLVAGFGLGKELDTFEFIRNPQPASLLMLQYL